MLSQQRSSSTAMPMPRVGDFLKSLLQDVSLKSFFMATQYESHLPASKPSLSTVHQKRVSVELHYTPGFDESQLLTTILGIYEGIPKSFEFFRCSPDTTETELRLFVERVWNHTRTYMMFGVNKLPLHLQEVSV